MLEYLVLIALWCPFPLVIVGYLFLRRGLPASRGLLLFDIVMLLLGVLLPVAFFWREITGHIAEDLWLDERQLMGILVPVWAIVIAVPFLAFFEARCRENACALTKR